MANLSTLSFSISGGVNVTAKCPPPGNGANFTNILGNLSAKQNNGVTFQLGFGSSSGCGTKLVMEPRMLAPGANETLVISSGLTDILNNANVGFATIRGIYFSPPQDNANGANISTAYTIGNATNAFVGWFGGACHTQQLEANGCPYQNGSPAGKTVTASVADAIKVTNNDSGNTLTYVYALCGV